MRLKIAALLLVTAPPVLAEPISYPITIPMECFALAQREGVPTVIQNKYQAVKAKLKLASMKKSDPLVRECRAVVARAKRMVEQSGQFDKK
jgi:hypothetical protein